MTGSTASSRSTTTLHKQFKSRRRRKRSREEEFLPKISSNNHVLYQLQRRELTGQTFSGRKKRQIAFRQLATPPTEAVLGLTACGSYIIGLQARHDTVQLVQRAVPSRRGGAPMVQRIPLPCCGLEAEDSLVATVPVDILLSGDIGVARIQHSSNDLEDAIGTMVLFHLETGATASCPNVRFGGGQTHNNLLWKVNQVPHDTTQTPLHLCSNVKRVAAGRLILNDEDDGYRLTWTISQSYPNDELQAVQPAHSPHNNNKPTITSTIRDDLVVREETWQQQQGGEMMIACEAFLSIEAVLDDIRARRKTVFSYNNHIPGFFYNLVSVDASGRYLTVAICFSNLSPKTKTPSSIAVIVQVDVYTQSYQELEWAQRQKTPPSSERLKLWSQQFALERRRKEISLETKVDKNSLDERQQLYPDCDVLSNAAVRQEVPVQVLRCRSGTTELVYQDAPLN